MPARALGSTPVCITCAVISNAAPTSSAAAMDCAVGAARYSGREGTSLDEAPRPIAGSELEAASDAAPLSPSAQTKKPSEEILRPRRLQLALQLCKENVPVVGGQ